LKTTELPPERQREIAEAWLRIGTVEGVARELGCSKISARKYGKWAAQKVAVSPAALPATLPDPAPLAGGPALPEAVPYEYKAFAIDTPGACGVLSDIHVPYHDKRTVEAWVADCERMGARSIFLNGDVLDFYQLSDYLRDPSKPRMREEILKGRQLLEYLRSKFPRARIVYKEGNHDERLKRYLATRAPDMLDLEDIRLERLLHAADYGVEWVEDKRVVMVGKLPVIHGHEYRGGGGVMPARWLYLRTGESAMMGHLHQPTFYSFRTLTGKEVGMWSVGCACHLSPLYAPLNQWGHGWAVIEVSAGGEFHVHNRRMLRDGQVV
jgi:predicted phosphodiesterase